MNFPTSLADAAKKLPGYASKLASRARPKPKNPDPFTGFALGLVGANVGLILMTLYQDFVAPKVVELSPEPEPDGHQSDDVSAGGRVHKEGESAPAAVGRLALEKASGQSVDHSESVQTALSYGVHWGFGMLMGGLYGAARAGKGQAGDVVGGLAFGTGLWALGDETVVPALGLQGGPAESNKTQHGNRLAAHLLYGAGLAIGTAVMTELWKNRSSGRFDLFWDFEQDDD